MLDRERHVIWVRGGKGHKDRQVMLAEPLRDLLAAYWRWKRPARLALPSGGVVNVISKSGTNSFHGDMYEFLRNQKLDAAHFFSNASGQKKAALKRNQFGTAAGALFARTEPLSSATTKGYASPRASLGFHMPFRLTRLGRGTGWLAT